MNSPSSHIPFALLVDIVEGRRQPDAHEAMHLADCFQCTRDVAWLSRTLSAMRADRSESAPEALIAGAKRLFRPPLAEARPRLRERLTAMLNFDSMRSAPAFGLRSGAASERQLLFNAGDLDVDLRIAQQGPVWSVAGQILGSEAGRRVELKGPQGTAAADISELGEFVLPPLPSGRYSLTLQLDDVELDIPELELGEA